ncbi:MAG: hypothetical protein JWM80_2939, partial [Cyanobacteria bacterium RYN_339]|nr:hypothetical protein [Cyanobacteria bacterium RYN_339]
AAERGFWLAEGADGWTALAGRGREGRPLAFQREGISQGIVDWVNQQAEPLSLLDAGATEGWQARQSVQALGLRTVWCLPAAGEVVYLDTTDLALADPEGVLAQLMELLAFAAPLLGV